MMILNCLGEQEPRQSPGSPYHKNHEAHKYRLSKQTNSIGYYRGCDLVDSLRHPLNTL